jgi:hypothetical protein
MNSPGLRALQESFAKAVLEDDSGVLASRLDPGGENGERRLAIYRRAVAANLVGALRGAHPVVVRLVGDAFFHEAARRFSRASPPASGDLNRFGSAFGGFLAAYAPAASMPWLGDVARLEWACHEASMAADGPPLDLAALARVPPSSQPGLRFSLHPSARLVRSGWPILAVWEANQPDRDGTPDREAGEDNVLVWREAGGVRAMRLEGPEAAFVEALGAGRSLAEAAGEGDWDLPGLLVKLASQGVLGPFRPEIADGSPPISG